MRELWSQWFFLSLKSYYIKSAYGKVESHSEICMDFVFSHIVITPVYDVSMKNEGIETHLEGGV